MPRWRLAPTVASRSSRATASATPAAHRSAAWGRPLPRRDLRQPLQLTLPRRPVRPPRIWRRRRPGPAANSATRSLRALAIAAWDIRLRSIRCSLPTKPQPAPSPCLRRTRTLPPNQGLATFRALRSPPPHFSAHLPPRASRKRDIHRELYPLHHGRDTSPSLSLRQRMKGLCRKAARATRTPQTWRHPRCSEAFSSRTVGIQTETFGRLQGAVTPLAGSAARTGSRSRSRIQPSHRDTRLSSSTPRMARSSSKTPARPMAHS